jgi:uncharacterized protein YndB with AHSA1/START domain
VKAAGKRAAYTWRYSADETTWTTLPGTIQPEKGLTAGTRYYCRVQSLTEDGTGNWSQVVTVLEK